MGQAAKLKQFRREVRRELARAAADPEIRRRHEQLVSELRAECFYYLLDLFCDALKEEGFGPKRLARVLGRVKGHALWGLYMDQGLPLEEACAERERIRREKRTLRPSESVI